MTSLHKWKKKDGSPKIMRIKSSISIDKTIRDLEKYMDFLNIPRAAWRMGTMSHGEGVGLFFEHDGVSYLIKSDKQTLAIGTPSIQKNARVILHIIQSRVLEMRKGVETVESAFGGFVDWLTTKKLPSQMDAQLQTRGIELMLPAPRNHQNQLEDKS